MTEKENTDFDLDVFFEDAKISEVEMSQTLMANILADAGEISAARTEIGKPVRNQTTRWWKRWWEPLGGVQGMAAVGLCSVLGVAVGYAGTDTLQSIPGVGEIVASIGSDPLDNYSYSGITSFNDFLAEG